MHRSVIGTGYVGLVTGACFAEFGVNVVCMDINERRIGRLEKGEVPFYEPGLNELVANDIRETRLSFTTDTAKAVDQAREMDQQISHMWKKWGDKLAREQDAATLGRSARAAESFEAGVW